MTTNQTPDPTSGQAATETRETKRFQVLGVNLYGDYDDDPSTDVDLEVTLVTKPAEWASMFTVSITLTDDAIDKLFKKGEVKLKAELLQSVRPVNYKGDWRSGAKP